MKLVESKETITLEDISCDHILVTSKHDIYYLSYRTSMGYMMVNFSNPHKDNHPHAIYSEVTLMASHYIDNGYDVNVFNSPSDALLFLSLID